MTHKKAQADDTNVHKGNREDNDKFTKLEQRIYQFLQKNPTRRIRIFGNVKILRF